MRQTIIGKSNILQSHSALYAGVHMEDNCTVDFLSVIQHSTRMEANQDYSGNPPHSKTKEWTEKQHSVSVFQFWPWTLIQLLLPQIFLLTSLFPVIGILFALSKYIPALITIEPIPHVPMIFALFPFAYISFMVLLTSFFILWKWILYRLDRQGHTPVRSEGSFLYSIYEVFENTWHYYTGTYCHGTFWMRLVHSLLGVNIGENTLMFTRIKYPDIVSIGDNCILESECSFDSAKVKDGVVVVEDISVGNFSIIGKRSVIRGGSKLSDSVVVAHVGLVS